MQILAFISCLSAKVCLGVSAVVFFNKNDHFGLTYIIAYFWSNLMIRNSWKAQNKKKNPTT